MATIISTYKGSLRTEAGHVQSGTKIITDAPVDNRGKGEAFSPTDLVCAALTSCMMTIMGIIAEKEGLPLDGLTAETTKTMASGPRMISRIAIDFKWPNPQGSHDQLKKLKKAALSCPVALSLDASVQQVINFDF